MTIILSFIQYVAKSYREEPGNKASQAMKATQQHSSYQVLDQKPSLHALALKPVSNRFAFKPVWPNHIH